MDQLSRPNEQGVDGTNHQKTRNILLLYKIGQGAVEVEVWKGKGEQRHYVPAVQ